MTDHVVKAPPLGVMPHRIWRDQRTTELMAAISRYIDAGKPVPREWVGELCALLEEREMEVEGTN